MGQTAIFSTLRPLLAAQGFTKHSTGDPWTFAVAGKTLLNGGSNENVLRLLLREEWLEHRIEGRSRFVLTEKGLLGALATLAAQEVFHRTVVKGNGTAAGPLETPYWESKNRRLWAGDFLLHEFPRRAFKEIRILEAFQEQNWEVWLDDPLPRKAGLDAAHRLHDAVYELNHGQRLTLLRFRTRDGEAVGWSWVDLRRG
jgi:hypothetical protein